MRLSVVDSQRCVGCQCCMFACARRGNNGGFAGSSIGVRSAGGMRNGFKIVVCSACSSPACESVCPTGALKPRKKGGGVLFNPKKCIGCGHCRDACAIGAVFWDDENNKPVICKYCGYCADYCPYGVIEFDKGNKAGVCASTCSDTSSSNSTASTGSIASIASIASTDSTQGRS